MIPRRFRNWVIFWTITTWIVLELLTYPKDVPITSGFSAVIKGFFSASVGAYPAWVMLLLAVICFVAGIIGLARKTKAKVMNVLLLVEGAVFLIWGVLAGGGFGGFSGSSNEISYNWAIQTVVVVLGGACVWAWAAGNPERAELTTWNTHQVWTLYRANWQGMVGLGILVVFMFMALLAPFLADHALLDPNAQIADPDTGELYLGLPPADLVLLQLVRDRPGGAERARAVHLEFAHLAHGRSARRLHVHRPRRRHRHRRRLLRRAGRAKAGCG